MRVCYYQISIINYEVNMLFIIFFSIYVQYAVYFILIFSAHTILTQQWYAQAICIIFFPD